MISAKMLNGAAPLPNKISDYAEILTLKGDIKGEFPNKNGSTMAGAEPAHPNKKQQPKLPFYFIFDEGLFRN